LAPNKKGAREKVSFDSLNGRQENCKKKNISMTVLWQILYKKWCQNFYAILGKDAIVLIIMALLFIKYILQKTIV